MYQYEMHLHTSESSACALLSAEEQVKKYKKLGYDGIIITDHFFNGNSTVPRNLPWEERIHLFCKGYENAKEAGDKIGLSVFLGWESNYQGTEFLIYGLDKEWLLCHPDMLSWSIEEQYHHVKEAGGIVVHAHPFRRRPYIPEVRLFPDYIDAVEAINIGNDKREFNDEAFAYANKINVPVIAGSDAHGNEPMHTGIAFCHKIKNIMELILEIKNGNYELIKPY